MASTLLGVPNTHDCAYLVPGQRLCATRESARGVLGALDACRGRIGEEVSEWTRMRRNSLLATVAALVVSALRVFGVTLGIPLWAFVLLLVAVVGMWVVGFVHLRRAVAAMGAMEALGAGVVSLEVSGRDAASAEIALGLLTPAVRDEVFAEDAEGESSVLRALVEHAGQGGM